MWVYVEGIFGGQWNGLFLAGETFEQAPEVKAEQSPVVTGDGYDGQFYHAIAHDPLDRRETHGYLTTPRVRYSRILLPGLAFLLGFGQLDWIDAAYQSLMLGSLWLAVFVIASFAVFWGQSALWGATILFLPLTIVTMRLALIDVTTLALIFAAVFAFTKQRWRWAWILLAASALSRDLGFLAILVLSGSLFFNREWRRGMIFLGASIPAAAWIAWVTFIRQIPAGQAEPYAFGYPLHRIVNALFHPAASKWPEPIGPLMMAGERCALVGLLAALGVASWLVVRECRRREIDTLTILAAAAVLSTVVFASFQSGSPRIEFDEPNSYGRSTGLLQICLLLLSIRSRQWIGFVPLVLLPLPELLDIWLLTARAARNLLL